MTTPEFEGQPSRGGLWGPGGYEVSVTADDEFALARMLEGLPNTSCTRPTARRIAQYARGLDHFRETTGPRDAAAVGHALGLAKGTLHDLLNPERTRWNAVLMRRRLLVAYMPQDVDAVALKLTVTDANHRPYAIMTAHAFGAAWQILLGAQRVRLEPRQPDYTREAHRARQALVDEVAQVLTLKHLENSTPVLTADPTIVQHVLQYLIEADQLTFLAEVSESWSYGGILPVNDLDSPAAPFRAGGTMRELFPREPGAPELRVRDVVLTAHTPRLGPLAIAVGPSGAERFFIARAHGRPDADLQAQAARAKAVELAGRFGDADFSEIAQDYGLATFNCPGDDRFQRHCTALTLRDCFAARSLAA